MDQKITDKWLDGFANEAEKAGYDPAGVSNLLKIASRMQIQHKYPEAYGRGFEEFTKQAIFGINPMQVAGAAAPVAAAATRAVPAVAKAVGSGIVNLKSVLAALMGAGLLQGGRAGLRGVRHHYGVMPDNPSDWDISDMTVQKQKIRQYMNTMRGMGLGGGGGSTYGGSAYASYPPPYPGVFHNWAV